MQRVADGRRQPNVSESFNVVSIFVREKVREERRRRRRERMIDGSGAKVTKIGEGVC
jgi:hypothetical protein